MRVVLRDEVDGVGRRGDIVTVAGGFARNFLLPEGRAIPATDGIELQAQAMRRARDMRSTKDLEAAQVQATEIDQAVITVTARAGATGRLFGSVGAQEIVEAVAAQRRVQVDRHAVQLAEPIKEVGTTDVTVQLYEDVTATLHIEVVAAT
jgi:large subunit ribosomal protein L9